MHLTHSLLPLPGWYVQWANNTPTAISSWERKRGKREIPDRSLRKEAEIWATHAEKSNVPLFVIWNGLHLWYHSLLGTIIEILYATWLTYHMLIILLGDGLRRGNQLFRKHQIWLLLNLICKRWLMCSSATIVSLLVNYHHHLFAHSLLHHVSPLSSSWGNASGDHPMHQERIVDLEAGRLHR